MWYGGRVLQRHGTGQANNLFGLFWLLVRECVLTRGKAWRVMQEYAERFYKSKAWQHTRAAYLRKVGGLCERCMAKGLYHPAVIVHHKVYITKENINRPEIALDFGNLEALCRACHEEEHSGAGRRYRVLEDGSVEIR